MNIGFDGSYAILKNNTTEGSYSKIVIDAFAECFPRHRIYVYTPRVGERSSAASLAIPANINIKQPRKTPYKTLWMNWKGVVDEMNRHHVHVYHGLAGRLPLRIGKARACPVVTIHSMAYAYYPKDYSWWDRTKRAFNTRQACSKADTIVATSEHTCDEIIETLGIDKDRIRVIYPAVDRRFMVNIIDAELDAVRAKYKLSKRYILVVSSLLEHKNVIAVLKAMKQMQDHDINLVLVGRETDYYMNVLRPYAERNHLMHRLQHISRAHANDMASIYHMAQAVVAPSRMEGFGLTIIEAQACGIPVITTIGTSQQEAAGEAALFFEPDDTDTLAKHLDQVITDEDLRQRLITAGRQNIQRFTHQRLATELDTLYHDILKR